MLDRMSKKVCLLYGGNSTERPVSLASHEKLYNVIKSLGYDVVDVDPSVGIQNLIAKINIEKPDCIFNGLYGGSGENGEIQGLLNMLNIPYTHSGVTASQVAMDKWLSYIVFEKHSIPTPKTRIIKFDRIKTSCDFDYPYVIKPICGGSSIGVFIIRKQADLDEIVWEYGDMAMVQEYIQGRELTVGVLNGKALTVTEIAPKTNFYDFETKYSDGMADHILPADISSNIADQLKHYAEKAYDCLGCRTLARADFRYDESTGRVYILEVNTQPGMTAQSLFPEQAEYCGIKFEQLVDLMIQQACCD